MNRHLPLPSTLSNLPGMFTDKFSMLKSYRAAKYI